MLNKHLLKLRKEHKLTQQELSSRLGIARTTYSGYELGTSEPDNVTIGNIADFYDVSIDYLLGRTDKRNEEEKKHPAEKLREYLDEGLSNDEIKKRMDFFVEFMQLNDEQIDEFISFVRWKLDSNKEQAASSSKYQEP